MKYWNITTMRFIDLWKILCSCASSQNCFWILSSKNSFCRSTACFLHDNLAGLYKMEKKTYSCAISYSTRKIVTNYMRLKVKLTFELFPKVESFDLKALLKHFCKRMSCVYWHINKCLNKIIFRKVCRLYFNYAKTIGLKTIFII